MTLQRTIPVGQGQFAIVDQDDYERVTEYKWYAVKHPTRSVFHVTGYIASFGFYMPLHRFILNAPRGTQIDHRDGNPLNNRRENLRFCTAAQNAQNSRKPKTNTSGFKGVNWDKRRQNWVARIKCNSKAIHIGVFKDPVLAAHAYDHAARRYHGPFARLNFPRTGEQKA
jgi:HNH endonuclease/AP2 domain